MSEFEKQANETRELLNQLLAVQLAQQKSITELIEHGNSAGQQFKHTLDGATEQTYPLELNRDSFFQDCALDSAIINYTLQPSETYLSTVPSRANMFSDRKIGMMTGMGTTLTGTRPVNPCDEGQLVGADYDFCKMNFPFSRLMLRIGTFEIDELLKKACEFEYDHFFFVGDVRGISSPPNRRLDPLADRNLIVQSSVMRAFAEMARVFQLHKASQFWRGNPVNNSGNGGYKEFVGFQHFFTDSFSTDAVFANLLESSSGDLTDCDSMNADIKDYQDQCINDATASPTIWDLMQEMAHTLQERARAMSVTNVSWDIVMPSVHFYELAKVLPCMISSDGCITLNSTAEAPKQGVIDLNTAVSERERLMREKRIRILGRDYRVVFDDLMPMTVGAPPNDTEITSDIYFVPRIVNGQETLWFEYLDYSRWQSVMAPIPGSVTNAFGWHDGGRYLSTIRQKLFCFDVNTKTECRLLFRYTPLAGKIMNVKSCTLQRKPLHQFAEDPNLHP